MNQRKSIRIHESNNIIIEPFDEDSNSEGKGGGGGFQ